jgi:hypothetical protein
MKSKIATILLLLTAVAFAQLPSTTLRVVNVTMPAANQVEYSIYLKNTSGAAIEYVGGQFHLSFNKNVLNSGTGTLTIVSTGLGTLAPKNPTVTTTTTPGQLRTSSPMPPGPGSGFMLANGDSVLVARFRLTTSAASFASLPFDLVLRNSTAGNLFIKFGAYISAVNTEIQNASTYYDADPIILPVELTSFTAVTKDRDIALEWITATEVNSSKFEIERSVILPNSAVRDWVKIGSVNAAGNSNSQKKYSFVDKKLNMGEYAYRLKVVDADGSSDYYKNEISGTIDKPTSFGLSQNYPNPFNPSTKIDYQLPENARVTIDLFSVSGEKIASLVNEQQEVGYYTYNLNASGLATGVYLYRLSTEGKSANSKFTSVKKMIFMK